MTMHAVFDSFLFGRTPFQLINKDIGIYCLLNASVRAEAGDATPASGCPRSGADETNASRPYLCRLLASAGWLTGLTRNQLNGSRLVSVGPAARFVASLCMRHHNMHGIASDAPSLSPSSSSTCAYECIMCLHRQVTVLAEYGPHRNAYVQWM